MGNLGLKVCRQVDNVDGIEWAFFGADTAPYAEALGNEGDLGVGGDLDAQFARADHGAGLFALLATFLFVY